MLFFKDFQSIPYRFGDEEYTTIFQNITAYADLIDQVKDNLSFYENVYINEGFRPDQMSIRFYDTPLYYWTFFLMNDELRKRGWPLDGDDLDVKIKKEYPNTTVTTKDSLTGIFKVGQTVVGSESGAAGVIIHRNLDLGQLVIQQTNSLNFKLNPNPEAITSTIQVPGGTSIQTVTISAASEEYNAAHHYINASGEIVDIDPAIGPGAQLTEVTNYEFYYEQNESLRDIKIIRPEFIKDLVSSYKKSIRG